MHDEKNDDEARAAVLANLPARPTVTAAVTSGQGLLQRIAPAWKTRRAFALWGVGESARVPRWFGLVLAAAAATWWYTAAATAWSLGFCWTMCVGLFTWPLRLVTRSRRKRKRAEAAHAEMLTALRENAR